MFFQVFFITSTFYIQSVAKIKSFVKTEVPKIAGLFKLSKEFILQNPGHLTGQLACYLHGP